MPAGIITSGNFPKLSWPGLREVFGVTFNEHPLTYPQMFTTVKSSQKYEEYLEVSGFPVAMTKGETEGVNYVGHSQGPVTRITNATYALGFQVTHEELNDNLYPAQLTSRRARALARSMREYEELLGAMVYNNAFTSGYTGGDGVILASTAHTTQTGLTYANTPTTGADLNELSLEDALIAIKGLQDANGIYINVMPRKLIVHRQNRFNAERLMKTQFRPGTANNDINAQLSMGSLPGGWMESVYLTTAGAWFITTDGGGEGYGMIHQLREGVQTRQDNDVDTLNYKQMAFGRTAFGWDNPRSLWCNPGP